jgi:uncharacterized protein YjiS (DUF1127 family)
MNLIDWMRNTVAEWHRRARDRHALAGLSEWQRRDLGLSSAVVQHEVDKPFWRA